MQIAEIASVVASSRCAAFLGRWRARSAEAALAELEQHRQMATWLFAATASRHRVGAIASMLHPSRWTLGAVQQSALASISPMGCAAPPKSTAPPPQLFGGPRVAFCVGTVLGARLHNHQPQFGPADTYEWRGAAYSAIAENRNEHGPTRTQRLGPGCTRNTPLRQRQPRVLDTSRPGPALRVSRCVETLRRTPPVEAISLQPAPIESSQRTLRALHVIATVLTGFITKCMMCNLP